VVYPIQGIFLQNSSMKMPSDNKVYIVGGKTLKHSTRPLPITVLKGFGVTAGLALKKDVHVVFEG
jgi:hypothetical protein